MLCNICLNTCIQYHNIPCGHHVCLACTEDYTNQKDTYQCPICLQACPLEKQPSKAEPPLPITSMLLYCIQCEEAFNFEQMKAGLHRAHSFDHLEKFLPLIREKTVQKLNKGLMIENTLLLSAQGQIDAEQLSKIRTLKSEVRLYFEQERQILLQRQEKIISQLMLLEERTVIFLQKRRQHLQGLYRKIHRINQSLQEFLDSDSTQLQSFDILTLLQQPFQQNFVNRTKQIERQAVHIPKFIRPSTLLTTNDSYTFLKYHEAPLTESMSSQQPERSTPRRVNLSSKISRKMNCL